MKRLLLITLACVFIFTGCKPRAEELPTEPVAPTVSSSSPVEEIKTHNQAMNADSIELIQFQPPTEEQVKAVIKTSEGDIEILLYPEQAPLAVADFIKNAQAGAYKGSTFYKIIENFYIETTATENIPQRDNDKPVDPVEGALVADSSAETSEDLWHFRGALGMHHSGDMSTFYIVQALLLPEETITEMESVGFPTKVIDKYVEVGGIPSYDANFTVFGHVTKGLDIVDKITNVRVEKDYYPEEPVTIIDIEVDTSNYTVAEDTEESK